VIGKKKKKVVKKEETKTDPAPVKEVKEKVEKWVRKPAPGTSKYTGG
jgi:hypothetical protein